MFPFMLFYPVFPLYPSVFSELGEIQTMFKNNPISSFSHRLIHAPFLPYFFLFSSKMGYLCSFVFKFLSLPVDGFLHTTTLLHARVTLSFRSTSHPPQLALLLSFTSFPKD